MRFTVKRGDDGWQFGSLLASASNRAYRENVRADRACIASRPALLPHDASFACFITNEGNSGHHFVIAAKNGENPLIQCIDPYARYWTSVPHGVQSPAVHWYDEQAVFPLKNAEWQSYVVKTFGFPDVSRLQKEYPGLGPKAATYIDKCL